jgi:hypothetical protein
MMLDPINGVIASVDVPSMHRGLFGLAHANHFRLFRQALVAYAAAFGPIPAGTIVIDNVVVDTIEW